MRKITFFMCAFFMCGLSTVTAQHNFASQGPETVENGAPVTVSINDMANSAAVPAGLYDAFSVSADWSEIAGGPYSSEADLTLTTTAGSVDIDPATSGSATNGDATTLIFSGDLAGIYDPSTDGFLEIVLNQSWTGTSAEWTNIVVTLFEVPACEEPIALDATNVTTTTAELSWTAGASETIWNIELVDLTAGGTVTGTPTFTGVTNPYIYTGLTPDNEYEFYVQADCDTDGTSIWSGPFMFRTACSEILPDYSADMSSNPPDACWDEASNGDIASGPMDLGSGSWVASNHDGIPSNRINLYFTNHSDWIISPVFDLSSAAPSELKVYVALTENGTSGSGADLGSDDSVDLLMTVDGGTTWTSMQSWTQGNVPSDIGEEITYDLSAITGSVQFAFLGDEGEVNDTEDVYFHVSKFQVRETPSCVEPTLLSISDITSISANFGWAENGTATTWDIELVDITAAGSATGTPTTAGTSDNPFGLTGLVEQNDYEVYVRSVCGGDVSQWSGPISFTTPCSLITPDYTADMSVNVPDACWNEAGSGDPTTGPMDVGASDWRQGTSYALGDSNAINLYFNNDSEWLLSPTFDLSAGGPYQLEVNVAVTDWNSGTSDDSMGSDDEVQLLMTTDNGATWTNITTWNAGNEPPVDGVEYVEDLTALTGNVMFAVWATDGTDDDSEDYDFHVGKFRVRAIPDCADPITVMNSDLTNSTADFTWAAGGTETTWEYANLPSPSTEPATGTSTMSSSVSITDLTPETGYDFYVRSDCGGVYSAWVLVSYTTPPANDLFADAAVIACGDVVLGSTVSATQDEADAPDDTTVETNTPADNDSPWVWYSFTGTGVSEIVTLSTCGTANTDFDTELFVYTGTSGSLTLIDDGYDECGGPAENYAAETSFTSDGATTYYIAVGGYNVGSVGDFQLTVSCAEACTADAGTLTADATPVELDGPTTISATPNGDIVVPTDYDVTYVLTSGATLIIEQAGATPSFDVTTTGDYIIHTLVAETTDNTDPNYLDLSVIVYGTTTGGDVLDIVSTNDLCASLDVTGAPIVVEDLLSFGEFENEAAFTYYPNPVKNTLTLNAQNTIEQVAMYNMLGQEVLRAMPNSVDSDLDMSNLQTGTYFVKVTIANITETIRVVKQ